MSESDNFSKLFSKYDVPAPRYTSYPTVPYWSVTPTDYEWTAHMTRALETPQGSYCLYLHIPYCETLCTFCGCNTSITKDHKKEKPYVDMILKEWEIYKEKVPLLMEKPLREIHLGGGTPTFLSEEHLDQLLGKLLQGVRKDPNHFQGSIEVDPRRTRVTQLEVLRRHGISRISLGVQDFEPEVQRLVNRIQPYDITRNITVEARRLGFTSVNFDLIYGLAKQTPESMKRTTELTVELRPDRIALYSFALVPWIKPQQRLFKDEDLPVAAEKRKLYEIAREILLEAGYVEVGMDHFALPTDGLAKAITNKTLHRNFMGYTDVRTDVLLGLGVSSISETPWSFHQNEKVLSQYEQKLNSSEVPTLRGHVLSEEDRTHRALILELMTRGSVGLLNSQQELQAQDFLKEMISDGLVEVKNMSVKVTEKGKPFLRNICVFFDMHLRRNQPQTRIFSQSI
ncbi:MAG: oxygen-independent coproporphyrinogen III oxidase [Bdellovibrionota bacterium]